MNVLAVASETYPIIKTGGLADVVGALPAALAPHGIAVRTLLPGYPAVLAAAGRARTLHTMALFGADARIRAITLQGLPLLVLDAPHLYDRPGTPYNAPGGQDWPDNPQRFSALGQAAAAIAQGALGTWRPALVHAHDWQAGYAIAHIHYGPQPRPATVFTVHNLAFQGWCPAALLGTLGLPPESFDIDGVEFYGGISPLKAGLRLADRITTVSPTYAAEITRPEHGQGLDGLLRTRAPDLHGILNGIDTTVWDPAKDPLLPARYGGPHARRRGRNKAALQSVLQLDPTPGTLLFGMVTRLSQQKGIDLVLDTLPDLLATGAQLAVLGSGDPTIEAALRDASAQYRGRIALHVGYDEALAHLIQAGSDALLVPSRFEPCGLTQLCAQRYGAIPVVARVGGLADTVVDANSAALSAGVANGIQFFPVDREAFGAAIRRAAAFFADMHVWQPLQRNAMRAAVGWTGPASEYAQIFHAITGNLRAGVP